MHSSSAIIWILRCSLYSSFFFNDGRWSTPPRRRFYFYLCCCWKRWAIKSVMAEWTEWRWRPLRRRSRPSPKAWLPSWRPEAVDRADESAAAGWWDAAGGKVGRESGSDAGRSSKEMEPGRVTMAAESHHLRIRDWCWNAEAPRRLVAHAGTWRHPNHDRQKLKN